jgi:WD40 repeat protein
MIRCIPGFSHDIRDEQYRPSVKIEGVNAPKKRELIGRAQLRSLPRRLGMAGISSLAFRNVFGLNKLARPNILYVGEEFIVFPAGNTLVVHNVSSRTQRIFSPPEEFSTGVSALAIADGKPNVAFADNSIQPSVCIFDIHTMHPRNFLHIGDDFGSTGFVALSFSGDGRYLLGHGGRPGWSLAVWDWEANQLVCSAKTAEEETPVTQCSFSPGKVPKIAVTGFNILKVYRLENNKLVDEIIPDPNIGNVVCHCWLTDTVLLCSNSSGDVISVTTDPQESVLGDRRDFEHRDAAVCWIVRHKKGFLTASEGGYLTVFDAATDNKFTAVRCVKLFWDEAPLSAHTIALDPSEETAIVSMTNNRVITMMLSNGETVLNAEEKPLIMPFHEGAILSCTTCCRKPLIATCGTDNTVRVWNYLDNGLEIVKEFNEHVYSVSLHPDGFSLLIGFGDKLRFCSVFYEDIKPIQEFAIRGCRCAKFSTGGHQFAAVNGSKIQIYSSLTFQLVTTLHRHSAGVHNLVWGESDTVLASVGNDGAMYIHRPSDSNLRDESYTTAQVQYFSIASAPDLSSLYISGTDMKLKEIQNGQVMREVAFQTPHTQLVMSNNGQMLFSGTKDGQVYSSGLPIGGESLSLIVHTGSVTSMAISHDDSLLFTTGEDGVLCILNIRDKDNRIRNPEKLFFSDEVQTTKAEIGDKANQLKAAEAERAELDSTFKLKKEMVETNHKTKEAKVRDRAKKEKDKSRILSENRKKEKDEAEMNNNAKEKQLIQNWEDRIAAQEEETGKKIIAAHKVCEQLQQEKERIENEWKGRIRAPQAKHHQLVEELQATQRKRITDAQNALQDTEDKKQKRIHEIEEMKRQIIAEKESAIQHCERRLRELQAEDERKRISLQDEHGNKIKECSTLQKLCDQQQIDRNKLADQSKKLQEQLNELNKEIARLNEEIKQKDATIVDRGMKIEHVKKENQELEKYHQVLNHQENVLHNQMDPLDKAIEQEVRDIAAMDIQLEAAHKRTADQNDLISQMQKTLQGVIAQERLQTRRLMIAQSYLEQAKYDLHEVVQHFHARDELKALFQAFYAKYMRGEKNEDIQLDEDVETEHRRQKATLEVQLKQLSIQQRQDDQFQTKEEGRLLLQNAALIEELQKLRTQNKDLQSQSALSKY